MVVNQKLGPIVMVDDNLTDLDIMGRYHRRVGLTHEFMSFQSGESFLDYVNSLNTDESVVPAVVLLDVNMPKMSGFEVLEKLRAMPRFKSKPPVIMVSNSDRGEDISRSHSLGADRYQVKPFGLDSYKALFREVEKLIGP